MFNQKKLVMNSLGNFEAFKLNKVQMNKVVGGNQAKEYCDKLYEIATNNELDEGAQDGLNAGWIAADCDQFDYGDFSYS